MYLILCALISLTVLLLIAFLSVSDIEREVINTRYFTTVPVYCQLSVLFRKYNPAGLLRGFAAVWPLGRVSQRHSLHLRRVQRADQERHPHLHPGAVRTHEGKYLYGHSVCLRVTMFTKCGVIVLEGGGGLALL